MLTVDVDLTSLNSVVMADGLAKQYVEDKVEEYLSSDEDMVLKIGTEVLFNWFRVAVRYEKIPPEEIKFTSTHGDLEVLANGKVINMPSELPSPWDDALMLLL